MLTTWYLTACTWLKLVFSFDFFIKPFSLCHCLWLTSEWVTAQIYGPSTFAYPQSHSIAATEQKIGKMSFIVQVKQLVTLWTVGWVVQFLRPNDRLLSSHLGTVYVLSHVHACRQAASMSVAATDCGRSHGCRPRHYMHQLQKSLLWSSEAVNALPHKEYLIQGNLNFNRNTVSMQLEPRK